MTTWSKLPDNLIFKREFMRLSDRLKAITLELAVLAAHTGNEGPLPPITETAWLLHREAEELETDLHELADHGVVSYREGVWVHEWYRKWQAPAESTERVRRWRERQNVKKVPIQAQEAGNDVTVPETLHGTYREGDRDREETERENVVVASASLKMLADAPPPSSQGKDPIQDLLEGEGMSSKEAARLSREHKVPEIMTGLAIAKSYACRHPTRNFAGILHTAIQERWTPDGENASRNS